ncbi:sugar ABC transporter substrate-binding protein [Castellaniella sp.]|uniref:sugar ABC transporter substrate-binding protein n=1 Tax=Castellaniella sp. TaxID=1955812 RepID=UPI0035603A10
MRYILASLIAILGCSASIPASAQLKDAPHEQWAKDVEGKSVVYIPVSLSLPLMNIWKDELEIRAKEANIEFTTLDPNLDVQKQNQMIASLIPKKPDVIIVHNPDRQALARILKQANKAGIYVIQINMGSTYASDAFIGVDAYNLGSKMGKAAAEVCLAPDAPSKNLAIVTGSLVSQFSIDQMNGMLSEIEKHPELNVVTKQVVNWDPKTDFDKVSTIVDAHKDLCAILDEYDGEAIGAARALERAGLTGKTKLISAGAGGEFACKYAENGQIYKNFSYQAKEQAIQFMTIAQYLMQSGLKPGSVTTTIYTPSIEISKDTLKDAGCQ